MSTAPIQVPPASTAGAPRSVTARRFREVCIFGTLVCCGLFSLLTTISIVVVLARETTKFFRMEEAVLVEKGSRVLTGEMKPAAAAGQFVFTVPADKGLPWFASTAEELHEKAASLGNEGAIIKVGDIVRPYESDGKHRDVKYIVENSSPWTIQEVREHELVVTGPASKLPAGETTFAITRDPVTVFEFLTDTRWSPLLGSEKHFGIWPLIFGTLLVSAVAMGLALPLGLVTAIWLSEYAPPMLRAIIKPALEVLAGIPTVVFGFFALTVITPALRWVYDGFNVYNAMSAGLAVGIMTLPIVTSLSEDALRAVPKSLREGAYGVGATRFEMSTRVVVPAALSGIIAAFLLAIARAVGETMIVALAAGASPPNLSEDFWGGVNPMNETQPMTGYMVQIFLGDASNFGPEYLSSYAVAATLFVMTLALTVIGHRVRVRFRQEYQ